MKLVAAQLWIWMTILYIFVTAFSVFVNFQHIFPSMMNSFYHFVRKNICRRVEGDSSGGGVSKGVIRFLDTFGTLCALTGLILGMTAAFIDQFDLTFEPEGVIKTVSY